MIGNCDTAYQLIEMIEEITDSFCIGSRAPRLISESAAA
jgi:hypothetical protein